MNKKDNKQNRNSAADARSMKKPPSQHKLPDGIEIPVAGTSFLPTTPAEISAPDFVYVSGDAYVDHPSFGAAIISRVLVDAGFTVAMLPQPNWRTTDDFKKFGRPKLGFLVAAGNIDSMVAHYTAAKKRRSDDYYSPGGKAGLRPDRATIVYCNKIREAYGDIPILIGGLEASLRRFAHYDYWENRVRRSILVDSRADILMYGMGEKSVLRIAKLLKAGVPVKKIRDVRGTAYICKLGDAVNYPQNEKLLKQAGFAIYKPELGAEQNNIPNYDELKTDKNAYARAFTLQYKNSDPIIGGAVVERYDDRLLVANPPQPILTREELDAVYALPYTRTFHPMYIADGGVPAIEEVRFSVTHNRGCFGACNFCAITFHQGRMVVSRSIESVVNEVKLLTSLPDFKGYIHDVGGPTANFRYPSCEKQLTHGVCPDRKCLAPKPCPNLRVDHSEYIELLREIRAVPKVKKVFIRSGIRYDYVMADKDDTFFYELVRHHISGQLKVAPEHSSDRVLACMGKPPIRVYDAFREKFYKITREVGLEQYLVPYLMSSHPGSTLDDAYALVDYMKKINLNPEQVQDFYPTPGTPSTVMFYTGINPLTGEKVYTATDWKEKQEQRRLLQPAKMRRPTSADHSRHTSAAHTDQRSRASNERKNGGNKKNDRSAKPKISSRGNAGNTQSRKRKK